VVKEATRLKQQLRSMFNEHCVRLESGFRLSQLSAIGRLLKMWEWTAVQAMMFEQLHSALVSARAHRSQGAPFHGRGNFE
jgi:hypothetical protein